jgi:hypothetical protein
MSQTAQESDHLISLNRAYHEVCGERDDARHQLAQREAQVERLRNFLYDGDNNYTAEKCLEIAYALICETPPTALAALLKPVEDALAPYHIHSSPGEKNRCVDKALALLKQLQGKEDK